MKVIVNFDVKDSCLENFQGIMHEVKNNLPKVDGCKDVIIYQCIDNPCRFTLVESWSSREAHQSHISSLVESGAWDGIAENLNTDPISSYFSQY